MSTYHLNLLTLLALSSVGRRTVQQILRVCSRDSLTREPLEPDSEVVRHLVNPVSAHELQRCRSQAQSMLDHARETETHVMGFGDTDYPARLTAIRDFPVILFIRGNPASLHCEQTISITGSRKVDPAVLDLTREYTRILSESGWHPVSGLSRGCESAVLAGALESKHPVTVILGSGLDRVNSRKSSRSVQEILEAGGCVISEHPNGTRSGRRQLIDRERIRTALSAGVLLIQASFSDQAMHTIRFAKSQNRPLAALDPGQHGMTGDSTGNHFLIRAQAAAPIRTKAELQKYLSALNLRLQAESAELTSAPPDTVPLQLSMWKDISQHQAH